MIPEMDSNTQEWNRLIAIFDGWSDSPYSNTPNKLYKGDMSIHVEQFEYHSSWNSIMPVCKKLESLPDSVNFNKQDYDKWVENSECLGTLLWKCDIIPVWEQVIRIIQWYNQLPINKISNL